MKQLLSTAALLQPFLYLYMRHFPIGRGKLRLLNSLGPAFWPGETVRQTTLKTARIKMACDLSRFIQRRLYFLGTYEPEQVTVWMKLAEQASVIMDVGANVGLYSLTAAAANPTATIHAFEPTPEMVARFQTNIDLNHIWLSRNLTVPINRNSVGNFTIRLYSTGIFNIDTSFGNKYGR